MTLRKILALTCLLLPMMASAHQFETGQRVPPIGITDRGELVLDKDQFSYKTWNSAQLVGKVRVLQHIAGRTSAKEKNATLIEAIKAAKLPHDRYQTTTIVNINSAKIIFPYRYLWDRGIKPLSSYAELILVTLVAFF